MDNYARHPAKKTKYAGIWFKSNLEAKTAEALDAIGVKWLYEPMCFRNSRYSGGQYTPDFWLPDDCTYIEVVGKIDDRHLENGMVFCELENVIRPDHNMTEGPSSERPQYAFVVGGGNVLVPTRDGTSNYCAVHFCENCNRLMFSLDEDWWICPFCNERCNNFYDYGNLFDLANEIQESTFLAKALNGCRQDSVNTAAVTLMKDQSVISDVIQREPSLVKTTSAALNNVDNRKLKELIDELAHSSPSSAGLLFEAVGVIDDGTTFTVLFSKAQGFNATVFSKSGRAAPVKTAIGKLYGERIVRFAIAD